MKNKTFFQLNKDLFIGNKRSRSENTITDSKLFAETTQLLNSINIAVKAKEKMKIMKKIKAFMVNCAYQKSFLKRNGLASFKPWFIDNEENINEINEMISTLNSMRYISYENVTKAKFFDTLNEAASNKNIPLLVRNKIKNLIERFNQLGKQIQLKQKAEIFTKKMKDKKEETETEKQDKKLSFSQKKTEIRDLIKKK